MFSTSTVLPLRARKTSPSFSARPPGMFSTSGITPRRLTRNCISAAVRTAASTAAAPAMSALHIHHLLVGLERQPATVERNSLTDQGERRRFAGPAIAQDDQPRRVRRRTGDAEYALHPFGFEPCLIPHFARDSIADFARASSKRRRVQVAGRQVDQFTGQSQRLAFGLHAVRQFLSDTRASQNKLARTEPRRGRHADTGTERTLDRADSGAQIC